MKKKLASLILAASITTASIALPAYAHDGWSQTNAPIAAQGSNVYVDLLLGNHSNHHGSYRVEAKWNMDTTKVYVTTPDGKKADISSTVFYTGEIGEEASQTTQGVNNGYIASFSSSTPGAYIISVEGDSIANHGVASRTLRSAKSFAAVSDIPLIQRVKYLQGFSRAVTPDRAELIPLFNPAAAASGQKVSVKLVLKGKPLADTEVTLVQRSSAERKVFTTDASGIVSFVIGDADYYLLRAKPSTDEKEEGKYDKTNYEATMTFSAQKSAVHLSGSPDPLPQVVIGGKEIDRKHVTLTKGTVYVDAAVIRTHLNSEYKGEGKVALRNAANSAGAAVEYYASVGHISAAVYVYPSVH